MNSLVEIRQALRTLLRSPLLLFAGVMSIGFGVGGATLIFGLVDALEFRPPPLHQPERLVELWKTAEERCGRDCPDLASPEEAADWTAALRSLEASATSRLSNVLIGDAQARRSGALAFVSAGFFDLLGSSPIAGRVFHKGDEPTVDAMVAVITESLSQELFGDPLAAVGKTVFVDNTPRLVVGVMGRAFAYPAGASMWALSTRMSGSVQASSLRIVGRLASGWTVDAASREFERVVSRRSAAVEPDKAWRRGFLNGIAIRDPRRIRGLWLLLGAALVVISVACLNLGAWFAMRVFRRSRELAIRAAIGSPAWRVALPTAIEILAVVGAGTTLAVGILFSGARIAENSLQSQYGLSTAVVVDWAVVSFAALLTLTVAALVALSPLFATHSIRAGSALRSAADPAPLRTRQIAAAAIVVAEIGLAMIAVAGASVLTKGYLRTQRTEVGYDTRSVVSAPIGIEAGADSARIRLGVRQLLDALDAKQFVGARAVWTYSYPKAPPPQGIKRLELENGRDLSINEVPLMAHDVSDGFFDLFELHATRGRLFLESDNAASTAVVLVNQEAARIWWPNEDPIGKRLRLRGGPWLTVVGVVPDAVVGIRALRLALNSDLRWPSVYRPISQALGSQMEVGARPRVGQADARFLRAVDEAVVTVGPRFVGAHSTPVHDRFIAEGGYDKIALTARLVGVLSALSLCLAVIGVYGVVEDAVRRRTKEIGIRIAMGAPTRHIVQVVLTYALRLALGGVVLGTVGTLAASGAFRRAVFGLARPDLTLLAGLAALFLATTALASLAPVYSALRIDPARVLRAENE